MTLEISAQVVTLEASVRVLTVGNRQITQSVANQLDWVQLWEMEPMGRVRLKDVEYAIGAATNDGDLVLAPPHECTASSHGAVVENGKLGDWGVCVCGCEATWEEFRHTRSCGAGIKKIKALPLIVLAGLR